MTKIRFHYSWLLALAAVVTAGSAPARANIILSLTPVSVNAGEVGAHFDVNVQNTGSIQNLASFSLALSVSDTRITFTGGNTSTLLPYLFAGDSFDGINGFPFVTIPPPNGLLVQASDLSDSGAGVAMGTTTLGLGRIFFDVAPNAAPGSISVTLVPGCLSADSCTSMADANLDAVPFSLSDGRITINGAAGVPEPSTLIVSLFGVSLLAWRRRRQ